jgi:hypothetical protein
MYSTKKYAAIKDNIIVATYHTADGIEGVKKSLGATPYDEIIETPVESHDVKRGHDRREYDKDFRVRKLSERVRDGLVCIPEGHKLSGEKIVPMTLRDKVDAGIKTLPPRTKIVGEMIEPMSDAEIIASGQATKAELDAERAEKEREELIQAEIRKMAEERLIAQGKI